MVADPDLNQFKIRKIQAIFKKSSFETVTNPDQQPKYKLLSRYFSIYIVQLFHFHSRYI
jgi:hypothetical protein